MKRTAGPGIMAKSVQTPFSPPTSTSGSLPPADALKVSETRLSLLQRLSERPEIAPARKKVLKNLVRAQAAIVKGRKGYLAKIN